MYDYLVVGAGFAGSVVTERLARGSGKRVLLVDKRPHVGGDAYDCYDEAGLLVHRYGPHVFHTSSAEVFAYLSQFTEWRDYEHRVRALVDGKLLPIPVNLDTVNGLYGLQLTAAELEAYLARVAEARPRIRNSEDVVVSKVGRDLYEKLIRGHARKQWGRDPSELEPAVLAGIPTRTNRDDRCFTDSYQAMPRHGFTRLFERMLDHPLISLRLETDYREVARGASFREVVYTGPVDEFFDFRFGKLPYRSLRFRHETLEAEHHQPVAVVQYPNEHDYIRVTEFKHLTGQTHPRTSIVYEYPQADGHPCYPDPRPEGAATYRKYQMLAEATPGVHFVGRLATYRYYDMDQVVGQALALYAKLSGARNLSAAIGRCASAVGQLQVPQPEAVASLSA